MFFNTTIIMGEGSLCWETTIIGHHDWPYQKGQILLQDLPFLHFWKKYGICNGNIGRKDRWFSRYRRFFDGLEAWHFLHVSAMRSQPNLDPPSRIMYSSYIVPKYSIANILDCRSDAPKGYTFIDYSPIWLDKIANTNHIIESNIFILYIIFTVCMCLPRLCPFMAK